MKNAGGVSKWHVGSVGSGSCPSGNGNGVAALASNAACGMPPRFPGRPDQLREVPTHDGRSAQRCAEAARFLACRRVGALLGP